MAKCDKGDAVARIIARAIRSKSGFQAAFRYKRNATRFIKALKAAGYKRFEKYASSGPTVDARGWTSNAYYVVADWC